MKYFILFLLVMVVAGSQADVPIGRFTQEVSYGAYRDIRIASNGKTAVWITKDCHDCKEVISDPVSVSDIGNGFIRIGKTEFEVDNGDTGFFHPSLGTWGKTDRATKFHY